MLVKVYDEVAAEHDFPFTKKKKDGIICLTAHVKSKAIEDRSGLEKGDYYIYNIPHMYSLPIKARQSFLKVASTNIKQLINKYLGNENKILVVGLGNDRICADSLGSAVLRHLLITASINKQFKNKVFALEPDIFVKTGLQSCEIVRAITKVIKPNVVIIIDSLATESIDRLGISFQFCDVGTKPAGALHNNCPPISKQTINIPCISIGVPLMFLSEIKTQDGDNMVFAPKDIEICVQHSASIIGRLLNDILFPELTAEELFTLRET